LIDGIYFEEHGPPNGEPLVLSPGLGGSGAYWAPNLTALAERYRVIVYDHRGTARSDRKLPDTLLVEDMADDVLALLDALGLERAHVVGHAAGGLIGLALALAAPHRLARLVVVNGWSALDPNTARCFEARLALLRDSGVHAYLRAQPIFLYPATWTSEHRDSLDEEIKAQLAAFPGAETMEKRIAALQTFYAEDRLQQISAPVLGIAAKDDLLVPYTCTLALAEGIPGASAALMDWGGHACNVTDPDRFNALVLDFLGS
jgi:aminoacrylate hydrolase